MDLPKQHDRMKDLNLARLEMSKQVAKERLSTARNGNVPAASDSEVKAGDKVLFDSEEPREWIGPYLVLSCDQKQVVVNIDGTRKPYSMDKDKIYNEPFPEAPFITSEVQPTAPLCSELGSTLDDAQKPGDPREGTQEFDDARQKEIDGLLSRGTFCPVRREDIPENANILGGRFVCTLKNVGTENEKPKARYVAQGHNDKEKPFIVHNITALRQSSIKIIVSTAAVQNFRLFFT